MIAPTSKRYLYIELIILFLIIPVLLVVPGLPFWVKIFPVVTGFTYVLFIIYSYSKFKFFKPEKKVLPYFGKTLLIRFIPIVIAGTAFVYFFSPQDFFGLVRNDISLWATILFVYSVGSVLPQEVIYRNFFYKRYRKLFNNTYTYIVINALLFALCHLFLKSWIVLLMTFVGGILFAMTYEKTKSTFLVTVEHSLYGLWLFTAGIGGLLAFPS